MAMDQTGYDTLKEMNSNGRHDAHSVDVHVAESQQLQKHAALENKAKNHIITHSSLSSGVSY
jgi:hypothetical protein